MILSDDTITPVKPPYHITPDILKTTASISEKLGQVAALHLALPSPQLRKHNKIKTIHSSLQIEGNSLTEKQISMIVEGKRVAGPSKDVLEVQNALKVYENLKDFNPLSQESFLKAHQILMEGLVPEPGKFRKKGVGIMQGKDVALMAPGADRVPFLMQDLFAYLKNDTELTLLKSCVFHYELEFIHPFEDGNGRMGRLWQTVLLMQDFPVFEFLPLESLIKNSQHRYYEALSKSDKLGHSTPFLLYMLSVIDRSLNELLKGHQAPLKDTERLEYFLGLSTESFSRKEYRNVFKNISSATASRDLKKGVELGLLKMTGNKSSALYTPV